MATARFIGYLVDGDGFVPGYLYMSIGANNYRIYRGPEDAEAHVVRFESLNELMDDVSAIVKTVPGYNFTNRIEHSPFSEYTLDLIAGIVAAKERAA